jgi:hypothetical protein
MSDEEREALLLKKIPIAIRELKEMLLDKPGGGGQYNYYLVNVIETLYEDHKKLIEDYFILEDYRE